MLKLNKYEQQIILACKGKSELYRNNLLSKEKSVYNTIANIIDIPLCELEDYSVYYWLFQTIKLLDINSEKNIVNNIIENMFADDNKISIKGMILKLISAIRQIQVREKINDEWIDLIELKVDDEILNKINE